MTYQQKLVEEIKKEQKFQLSENEKHDEAYRKSSAYHTELVDKLVQWSEKYPNYIDRLLDKYILEEESVFGLENEAPELTSEEKGRIYSLVRCKHMKRIALGK